MVEAEIGIHLFQSPIFLFQLFEAFEIGHFDAPVFALLCVIGALGTPVFSADRFDRVFFIAHSLFAVIYAGELCKNMPIA